MLCVLSRSLTERGSGAARAAVRAARAGTVTGVTHMCGFWKGGPAVFSVNLAMGLIGGLAKFSFRALRLPAERRVGHMTTRSNGDGRK